jgi:hypothetical protein
MAKKKATPTADNGQAKEETISGYFRKVFDENPQLLDTRSNDELYARWLKDHPGDKKVSEKVRQNLSNIKSVLRKQGRKQGRKKLGRPTKETQPAHTTAAPVVASATAAVQAPRKSVKGLDLLEEHIDDCLSLAKHLDREALANIISLLRRARNEVVWKMGETTER